MNRKLKLFALTVAFLGTFATTNVLPIAETDNQTHVSTNNRQYYYVMYFGVQLAAVIWFAIVHDNLMYNAHVHANMKAASAIETNMKSQIENLVKNNPSWAKQLMTSILSNTVV